MADKTKSDDDTPTTKRASAASADQAVAVSVRDLRALVAAARKADVDEALLAPFADI